MCIAAVVRCYVRRGTGRDLRTRAGRKRGTGRFGAARAGTRDGVPTTGRQVREERERSIAAPPAALKQAVYEQVDFVFFFFQVSRVRTWVFYIACADLKRSLGLHER